MDKRSKLLSGSFMQGMAPASLHDLAFCIRKGFTLEKVLGNGFKEEMIPHKKEFCQDRAVVMNKYGDHETTALLAVFDGHGEDGHVVAQHVAEEFPRVLLQRENWGERLGEAMRETCAKIQKPLMSSFLANLCLASDSIQKQAIQSGTTACVALMHGTQVTTCNLGDSACVVGRANKETGKWEAVKLSVPHKPEDPPEMSRIEAAGGRVMRVNGTGDLVKPQYGTGPARVFKKGKNTPGLAVSRSLGDTQGHRCGVTCDATIETHQLTKYDKILIMGSDGLFDAMDDQDLVSWCQKWVTDHPGGKSTQLAFDLSEYAQEIFIARVGSKGSSDGSCDVDDTTALVCLLNSKVIVRAPSQAPMLHAPKGE